MVDGARLRVGVIGCGTVAQVMHLPYLRSLPEQFELAALCDLSPGLLADLGERYRVPSEARFTDHRALLEADLDAVLVATTGSHAPAVLAAIAAGKHVLAEKPLCLTLREADQIEAAADRAGVTVMVAYMKRYDPGFRYGQQQVRALSDPRYLQINTLHPREDLYLDIHAVLRHRDLAPAVSEAASRAHQELLDEAVGGVSPALRRVYNDVFLGSMVHDVNALRALVGEPEQVAFTEIWPPDSRTPTVTTVLRHPGDLRTVYTWSYLSELRDYLEEIAVFGPAERVRIRFPSPFLKHWPTPVVAQRMDGTALVESRAEVSYQEAFREELRAFHECVASGRPPLTGVADARSDIALLQRILAAAEPDGVGGEAGRVGGRNRAHT